MTLDWWGVSALLSRSTGKPHQTHHPCDGWSEDQWQVRCFSSNKCAVVQWRLDQSAVTNNLLSPADPPGERNREDVWLFSWMFDFFTKVGEKGLDGYQKLDISVECDLSATYKGLKHGGGAKVHTYPFHCCGIKSDNLHHSTAAEPCSRWCKQLHSGKEDLQCYHHAIVTDERLTVWQTVWRRLWIRRLPWKILLLALGRPAILTWLRFGSSQRLPRQENCTASFSAPNWSYGEWHLLAICPSEKILCKSNSRKNGLWELSWQKSRLVCQVRNGLLVPSDASHPVRSPYGFACRLEDINDTLLEWAFSSRIYPYQQCSCQIPAIYHRWSLQ